MKKIITLKRKKNRLIRRLRENEKRKEYYRWHKNQQRPTLKYILENLK